MEIENTWVSKFKTLDDYQTLKEKPIAYFSAEYALSSTLPIYAGGLGILAGDIVKEAAKNDLPMVFVGLLYKKGQNDIITDNTIKNKEIMTMARDYLQVMSLWKDEDYESSENDNLWK